MSKDQFSDEEAYRRRVRALRRVYGSQAEFCEFTGIDIKTWNHYERGYPITLKTFKILKAKMPGLSADWLWFGETWKMDTELLKLVQRLASEDEPPESRRRRAMPKERRRLGEAPPTKTQLGKR